MPETPSTRCSGAGALVAPSPEVGPPRRPQTPTDECLMYLTIYIKAFDQERRNDWLEMEWMTSPTESTSQVFIHLNNDFIRGIIGDVSEIDQLSIIIDPSAADGTDPTQIICLWTKVREVASLLSNMKHWNVRNLAIKLTSAGPGTFKLTSKPMGELHSMLKSDYNFLSLAHMAILLPLIRDKKMSATCVEWYYQNLTGSDMTPDQDLAPDRSTTPEPILKMIDILGAVTDDYGMWNLRDDDYTMSTFWTDVTLARMSVEVSRVDFAFELALDSAYGPAANHLRLQRFRTWKLEDETSALSRKNRKRTMESMCLNRSNLQYQKNLLETTLMPTDLEADQRKSGAAQDMESNRLAVKRNDAIWAGLLPVSPSSAPTNTQAAVIRWAQTKMGKLNCEMHDHFISLQDGVDQWSIQYPLGIPSLYRIHEEAHREEEHEEQNNETDSDSEDGVDDDGVFTPWYDASDDAEANAERILREALGDDDDDDNFI
ncbi:hypothetical protein PG985_012561 [Apiospora marii]|uniref:HNH nuclease domain-containing protein n=1 Tax=Apiospora marii TaxID=335849 RepID=A0ABR1RD16_9PEZI